MRLQILRELIGGLALDEISLAKYCNLLPQRIRLMLSCMSIENQIKLIHDQHCDVAILQVYIGWIGQVGRLHGQ